MKDLFPYGQGEQKGFFNYVEEKIVPVHEKLGKPNPGLLLGYDRDKPIYLPPERRTQHLWIPGLTGNGKTNLLKNLILQDIEAGSGLAFIDPHGDASEDLIGLIPPEHAQRVLYFDPTQPNCPSFNPFRLPYPPDKVTDDFLDVLRLMFKDSWGNRLEHILRHAIATLIKDTDPHCVADLKTILAKPQFRADLSLQGFQDFWEEEFPNLPKNALGSIYNKLSKLLFPDTLMHKVFSQVENDLDFAQILDGKILICNLSKGNLNTDATQLLGGFFVTGLVQAAFDRGRRVKLEDRKHFHLYVDEFQNYAIQSMNSIIEETSKFKLFLTAAHQRISQLPSNVSDAIESIQNVIIFHPADNEAVKFGKKVNSETETIIWAEEGEGSHEGIESLREEIISRCKEKLNARWRPDPKDRTIGANLQRHELRWYEDVLNKAENATTPEGLLSVAKSVFLTPHYNDDGKMDMWKSDKIPLFKRIHVTRKKINLGDDLLNLPPYHAIVKLGTTQNVHKIKTIPTPAPDPKRREAILNAQPVHISKPPIASQETLSPDNPQPAVVKSKNGIPTNKPPRELIASDFPTIPRRKTETVD